jgi:hypothetical protein
MGSSKPSVVCDFKFDMISHSRLCCFQAGSGRRQGISGFGRIKLSYSLRIIRRGQIPPKKMTTREGFAAVAEWIALDPDNETFVFRKFDTLAARNLLYMQARILSLEQQFDALDTGVTESNDMSLKDAARSWEELVKQDSEDEVRARRQMELIAETREALKEYCMYKDSSLFKAVANQT